MEMIYEANLNLTFLEADLLYKELKIRINQIEKVEDELLNKKFDLMEELIHTDKKYMAGEQVKFLGMTVKTNSDIRGNIKKTYNKLMEVDEVIRNYEYTLQTTYAVLSKIVNEFNMVYYKGVRHIPIKETHNYLIKHKQFLFKAGLKENATEEDYKYIIDRYTY